MVVCRFGVRSVCRVCVARLPPALTHTLVKGLRVLYFAALAGGGGGGCGGVGGSDGGGGDDGGGGGGVAAKAAAADTTVSVPVCWLSFASRGLVWARRHAVA
jgi:hypothetical protein